MRSLNKVKPMVHIYYDDPNMIQIPIRKIKEGLEEEGVPWKEKVIDGDAQLLAKLAAEDSQLGIGIGLLHDGTCLLQHRHMPKGSPIMRIISGAQTMDSYRTLGSNAARLVKNMPLKWF